MTGPSTVGAPGTAEAIHLLLVEDDRDQRALADVQLHTSKQPRFAVTQAESLAEALALLAAQRFDLVMLDLFLGDSRGVATFHALHGRYPDVPVVIVSASKDEDAALQAIRSGGQDYLVKGEYERRGLIRALSYAYERNRLQQELDAARREAQTLRSILPVCSYCKKIRDHAGRWLALERYMDREAGVAVSHGLCPECEQRHFPDSAG
jgi:DNA-binding NtrC family response regulator